jgi:hypothetical protein
MAYAAVNGLRLYYEVHGYEVHGDQRPGHRRPADDDGGAGR